MTSPDLDDWLDALESLLAATREKEGNVRVFLGFGYADLFFAGFAYHLAQGVVQVIFIENGLNAHESIVVVGEGNVAQVQLVHVLLMEIALR